MADEKTYLTPDVQAVLGTELTADPEHIERNDLRFYAEAIRLPEAPKPLYSDEVYARGTRFGGLIAPPSYFTRLARRGGYSLPLPLPDWVEKLPGVNAGAEVERLLPVRPGDTLYTVAKVVEVYERGGSKGKLLFFIRDFEFTNQLGQYVGKTRRITIKFPERPY
jgi:acyl dehydratase